MIEPSRLWAVVLLLASLPIGFIAGGWIGGLWLVPADAGLAGGAMVFWYALLGAIVSLFISIVIVKRYSPRQIKPLALVLLVLALVGLSWLVFMLQ